MKTVAKVIAILLGIVVVSAVMAPTVYQILPMFKFERILNRLIMIFTIAAALAYLRVNRPRFLDGGLNFRNQNWPSFFLMFATGFGILTILTGVRFIFGDAEWSVRFPVSMEGVFLFLEITAACLIIGVIEEFFFRGFLFSSMRERLQWPFWASIVLTNLIYTAVHFVTDKSPYVSDQPRIVDSFRVLLAPFSGWLHMEKFWPEMLGLFIFGVFLNGLVIQAKSLLPAMGFHAGCVFFVKLDGHFIHVLKTNPMLFGTDRAVDGMLAWALLIIAGLIISKGNLLRPRQAVLVAFFLCLTPHSMSWAANQEHAAKEAALRPIYRFSDNLQDAETSILYRSGEERTGQWKGEGFVFPGLNDTTEIQIKSQTYAGEERKGIFFHPAEKAVKRLRFSKVPPGARMKLFYGLDDAAVDEKNTVFIYLKIWLGKHELSRIIIPNKKGWHEEILPLGIVSFLKQDVPITFEITCEVPQNRPLSFDAEIFT